MIGIRAHITPKVVVTDGTRAVSPQFPELVSGTVEAGFVM